MNWYLTALKKYFDFNGRARRREYWLFQLFQMIAITLLVVIDQVALSQTFPS
ncbi:Inner membrane protein yhaI [Chromobacterium violaceum]|uniref:Inner membrane protein yhaI n=1 Tax=Chromobacterium violaceum TaxID=536 RepID=A0A3S4I3U9_CHRVL|nr:Inner membrane protein yhaI [Chromobacterium violaceum]